jgi:hypothetical protein
MLEEYFIKPDTVDRIQGSWIGPEIERYVAWLAGQGYRPRTVLHRVPLLLGFAEFAWGRGARIAEDLPGHVEAFVAGSVARREALARRMRTRPSPNCAISLVVSLTALRMPACRTATRCTQTRHCGVSNEISNASLEL